MTKTLSESTPKFHKFKKKFKLEENLHPLNLFATTLISLKSTKSPMKKSSTSFKLGQKSRKASNKKNNTITSKRKKLSKP